LLLCAVGPAGSAELEAKCGVEALNAWDDTDTGAAPATFYFSPAQGEYYPLGVTADGKASGTRSTLCLVRDNSSDGSALAPPVGYERIWWDRGSRARRDGAVWRPKCPQGYVGAGFVVQANYRKPGPEAIRCVREDLTVRGTAEPTGPVFKDSGSGAYEDLSVWRVKADDGFDVGAVFAWQNYAMPKESDGVRLLRKSKLQILEAASPAK
jgi:hypothetical protein